MYPEEALMERVEEVVTSCQSEEEGYVERLPAAQRHSVRLMPSEQVRQGAVDVLGCDRPTMEVVRGLVGPGSASLGPDTSNFNRAEASFAVGGL